MLRSHSPPLTYLLTPCSRVFLEKLTGFEANQEIHRILWNSKVHYRTHKRPPSVPILSQLHPVPTTPSHLPKIHPNIILPPTPWSPQCSPTLWFPHQHPVHTSPLLHTCPAHLITTLLYLPLKVTGKGDPLTMLPRQEQFCLYGI
jgi:hypothetical protein